MRAPHPLLAAIAALLITGICSQDARSEEIVHCSEHYQQIGHACTIAGSSTRNGMSMRSTILANGKVFVGGVVEVGAAGRVIRAGCLVPAKDSLVVDCPGAVVAPGAVNLHEHLNYSAGHRLSPPLEALEDRSEWQRDPKRWPESDSIARTANAELLSLVELRHLLLGTTSLAGRGHAPSLARNLDHGDGAVVNITYPFGKRFRTIPEDCSGRKILKGEAPTLVHAGEGTGNRARREIECLLESRAAYHQRAPLTVVHAIAIDDALAARLAEQNVSVSWSPYSNMLLYRKTAPVKVLIDHGVPVSLGTDWIPSGSVSLLDEARFARSFLQDSPAASSDKILDMLTQVPARSVGMENEVGVIAPGAWADLVGVRLQSLGSVLEQILEADSDKTLFVMIGGSMQFANPTWLPTTALMKPAQGCTSLPTFTCVPRGIVCGGPVIAKAIQRPDAEHILCPIAPPVAIGDSNKIAP